MKVGNSIILEGINGELLKVNLKNNGDLTYTDINTKYEYCREDTAIASNVSECSFDLDKNGYLSILYMDKKGIHLYKKKNEDINTKKLLTFSNNFYNMKDIGLKLENKQINLFFVLYGKDLKNKEEIIHYNWNGEKGHKYPVCTLKDKNRCYNSYELEVLNDTMHIFFCDIEKNESYLKYCSFEGDKWSKERLLFKIKGELIDYYVVNNDDTFILAALTKQHLISTLTIYKFNLDFKMLWEKNYETVEDIKNPIIMIEQDNANILWQEKGDVFFSILNNKELQVNKISSDSNDIVQCCEFISAGNITAKKIFIKDGNKLNLISPQMSNTSEINNEEDYKNLNHSDNDIIRKVRVEIEKSKLIIDKLENKISEITLKLETKEKKLRETMDYIERLTREKETLQHNNTEFYRIKTLCNNEKAVLEVTLKELQEKYTISIKEISILNEKINDFIKEKETLQHNNTELYEIKTLYYNEKALWEVTLKELQEKNDIATEEIAILNEKINGFIKEKETLEHNNTELYKIKILCDNEKSLFEINLKELKENNDIATEEISILNEKIEEFVREKAELALNIENERKEHNRIVTDLNTKIAEQENIIKEYEKNQGIISRFFRR